MCQPPEGTFHASYEGKARKTAPQFLGVSYACPSSTASIASSSRVLPTARKTGSVFRHCKCSGRSLVHVDASCCRMPTVASSRHTAERMAAACLTLNASRTRIQPCSQKCSNVSVSSAVPFLWRFTHDQTTAGHRAFSLGQLAQVDKVEP